MMRCRITYQKTEPLRYTGNLDMQKIWERFLRRAGLQIAYSQGFHPQPRIQQACPLPLGFLSLAELADIFLDGEAILPKEIEAALSAMPYPGIEISSISEVNLAEPSLATRVVSTTYRAEFLDAVDVNELSAKVANLLAAPQLIRNRRDKQYDLLPLIEALAVEPTLENQNAALLMKLSARQGATGRPEEVLAALDFAPFDARYIRTRIIFTN